MVLTQPSNEYDYKDFASLFPYHYGSYATKHDDDCANLVSASFHTTMVLTQPEREIRVEDVDNQFPYHYGSYATQALKLMGYIVKAVSIPLWFLRNIRSQLDEFQAVWRFHTTMVLTQLRRCKARGERPWFPYHYGSYATI